jgi:predicted nucleic acid-binding protein
VTVHFLDTGFLIALESADDQHHAEAVAAWHDIQKARTRLVTTSYVFDEVTTFFNSRGHHAKAVEIGEALLNSQSVTLVHVEEPLFAEAWREFARHADKRYSLTDCVSFVVMRRRRIKKALAFDKHFIQAGFDRLP